MKPQRRPRDDSIKCFGCEKYFDKIFYISLFERKTACYWDVPLCSDCVNQFNVPYTCKGDCRCTIGGNIDEMMVYIVVPGARHETDDKSCTLEKFAILYET